MTDMTLAQAVEAFAATTAALPDEALEREWQWRAHDEEGVRFAFFVTYQELRELAALAAAPRPAPASLAAQDGPIPVSQHPKGVRHATRDR